MNAQDSSLLRALSHWLFEKRARFRCSNVAIHNRQLAACLLLCLGLHPLHAELPLARLFTVFPPGARAGGTVEVSVSGADLDGPVQLLFSNTNLSSVPKPGDANKFLVTLGSNALPGVCEARFVGRFGISNPRAFVMGDLPELVASEGNNALSSALEVPLGTLVNGRAKASAADFFKFSAKKNQRVLIECATRAIDSRMEPTLILHDASGRELERARRGGLLDFTALDDGQFVLKVHDLLFRGGSEYFYRLAIRTGPRIDFVFPPAGLLGTKSKYVLYGRNLPGGVPCPERTFDGKGLEQLSVEIELAASLHEPGASIIADLPDQTHLHLSGKTRRDSLASEVVEGVECRLLGPHGASNPFLISFATAAVIPEQEPNNAPGQAQKLSLPCEVVGQFYPAGDQDRFVFEARKGAVYWAEVFSQRLGLPTSPFMLVQRLAKKEKEQEEVSDLAEVYGSENNFGGAEFKTSTLDPAWRFEVKEDGRYQILVRDLFNLTQSNPGHVYRLSLRQEAPDFRLMIVASAPPPAKKDTREAHVWVPFLRGGETIPLKVLAFRRDNFNAPIQIGAEALPPGVNASEATIEEGKNSTILLLTADEQAPTWAGPIKIVGKAKGAAMTGESNAPPAREMIREACGGTVVWNVGDYNTEPVPSRLINEVVLAVSGHESAPITITTAGEAGSAPDSAQLQPPKIWPGKAGAKMSIPLQIKRRGDFTETLKLKVTGLAGLDSMKEIDIDSKATNATLELDLAQHKISPGTYAFYLQTQTKGKYRDNPDGARAAESAAKEAEKVASELAAVAKSASEALAAASKASSEVEAVAKQAAAKLAAAKDAEEKTADKQDLVEARVAAEKESAEAAAKASRAAQTRVAAEKTAAEASGQAKQAEEQKNALASRAREMAEKAKPKEVTLTVYSAPIHLKVIADEKKLAEKK